MTRNMEPWRLTATQVLEKLRLQELTVEQYASSLLDHISQRDDHVKAWSYLNSQAVLDQARELDRVPSGKRGPLHGLPVAIKDIILTKGENMAMPLDKGS